MPRTPQILATLLALSTGLAIADEQDALSPVTNAGEKVLQFDWPAVRIGTAEYAEGPTGVTVIHFPDRAYAAVDVRGGGPGTVNTDLMRLGYDIKEWDAIVFAAGSTYGLEATTAVATALKDDRIRNGDWVNLALTAGAIVYDFGERRLNEIYPDKRLAQAAYRAARPGIFPLGAQGAGRFVKTGGVFGCNAHSGQGGAFRQIGDLKIAAFVVVNALGVVSTREGKVAACYSDAGWPKDLRTADLLSNFPASAKPGSTLQPAGADNSRNTTISLVVTNQRLAPSDLQRLATHVHGSMSRALQPFATEFDGDVLYAVSTGELEATEEKPALPTIQLDVIAAEVMWDAILSSVPQQLVAPQALDRSRRGRSAPKAEELQAFVGDYVFSPFVSVRITVEDGKLFAQATGERKAYAIGKEARVELLPVSAKEFTVPNRYPLTLSFATADRLVMNPGHWQQTGLRQAAH
jgi:L-aminopeptidase/D-esterase-like protein